MDRSFLVAKQVNQQCGFEIRARACHQFFGKTVCNQGLRRPAVELIQALKDSRFDAEAPDQALVEVR